MNKVLKKFLLDRQLVNLGDIKWAHAVNSQWLLRQAIADPAVDFLEVDISLSKDSQPIAAHYADESDLSFIELLNIVKYSQKGLKLDFKEQNAVMSCLEMLAKNHLNQPIILNADVLSVEDAPAANINPEYFINTCTVNCPEGLLSLGWRTTEKSIYSAEDIDKMLSLCSVIKRVTFPVRTSILPESWDAVKKLMANQNHTLTIWNSEPIDRELQTWVIKNANKQRCFYDFTISN